jgi:alpha-L-fucosidase
MIASTTSDWFVDAKFGLFIHWGLYSIPAGIWQGEPMGRNWYAEWIRAQGNWPNGISREEYDTLLSQFNPQHFDADQWAAEAVNAGMKYLLVTAKHHDGFALWPSKVSAYNVVDATPFKRDILGELVAACRRRKIVPCFYYSHWLDWDHPGGGQPPWTGSHPGDPSRQQPSQEAYDAYWHEKCLPQVRELLEYDPGMFWFDCWQPSPLLTDARLDALMGLVRDSSPRCLINSRIGTTWNHSKGDALVDYLSMGDNEFPENRIDRLWETSGTLNRSWGYSKLDFGWRPIGELLRNLVDNVSRGGNYQLNVGPLPDGRFEPAATKRLRQIGAWMSVNGESIHGTRPAPCPEPSWGRLTITPEQDGKRRLFAFYYGAPETETISIAPVTGRVRSATVLETGQPMTFTQDNSAVTLRLPEFMPDEHVTVFALELQG